MRNPSPASPPAPKPATGDRFVERRLRRTRRAPFDGRAWFEAALALFPDGHTVEAVRSLERALRLDPLLVVPLVHDPALDRVRRLRSVRELLERFRKEQERRAYTGYA